MYYFSSGTGPEQEEQIQNSQFSVWDNKASPKCAFQGAGRGVGVGDFRGVGVGDFRGVGVGDFRGVGAVDLRNRSAHGRLSHHY